MKAILLPLIATLAGILQSRALLHVEILALRQQLTGVIERSHKRLRFRRYERLFWVGLYRVWPGCFQALQAFKADSLMCWHRKGFRPCWTWKSRRRRGGRRPIVGRS